jgi:hypothetical protein
MKTEIDIFHVGDRVFNISTGALFNVTGIHTLGYDLIDEYGFNQGYILRSYEYRFITVIDDKHLLELRLKYV